MKSIKKYSILAVSAISALCAAATEPNQVHVYVNPGHGGHDSDDRNVVIYPFTSGDPEGYWESNSNLDKGLRLRDILEAKGCKVTMSRVTNTTADDLGLTTIGYAANNSGADLFFAIHSNATGTGSRVNFPITLYRGYTDQPQVPKSDVLAKTLYPHLKSNEATVWHGGEGAVYGDWTFYPSWGTQGLGVLRVTAIPALLSEGSFHDYIPETYRLMNKDFCWLEAWQFAQTAYDFMGVAPDKVGHIAGCVTDSRILRNVDYITYDRDKLLPICGAKVELKNAEGKVVQTYTTDALFNGFYMFKQVEPGKYKICVSAADHYSNEVDVVVEANKVSYSNITIDKVRDSAPVVVSYTPEWKEGDAALLCNTPISFTFNWDMDVASTEAAFKIEPAVKGTFAWEDANHIMTFVPSEPYMDNTLYTVTLGKSAKHGGGVAMENVVSFKFKTDARRYLTATMMWPREGAEVHYTTPVIELHTDSTMNCGPIMKQILVKDAAGNTLSYNTRSMKYGKTADGYGFVKLTLGKSLTEGETYTITYPQEIADLKGLTLDKDYTYTFKAVDAAKCEFLNGVDVSAPHLIDDCEAASKLAYVAGDSKNVKAASVGTSTTKLFGNKSIELKYEFSGEEGGEIVYMYAEPIDLSTFNLTRIVAFVNGDCSGNELYLITDGGFDSSTDTPELTKLDYNGWANKNVKGSSCGRLLGYKIVQVAGKAGKKGSVKLDNITKVAATGGVDEVKIAGLTVGPNPASDYIVASAETLIEGMALYDMNGVLVATTGNNAINVGEIADGNYLLVVRAGGEQSTVKVIVKH